MNACANRPAASGLCRQLVLAAMALSGGAMAQDEEPAPATFSYTSVSSERVPRADFANDAASPGLRVESVRWTQSGGHAFGIAFGVALAPSLSLQEPRTVMRPGFGLRWRSSLNDRRRLDVVTWRHLQGERDASPYGRDDDEPAAITTNIEMQFAPARSSFGAELGAVGLQLSSTSKLQLRIKRGGPMVYYRSRF